MSGEAVTFDPLSTQAPRLNPANALEIYDALQTGGDGKMFSVASQTWTNYTFGQTFYNVDGPADIEFCEVTWGRWHVEAAKVYLTGAYVRNSSGEVVPYAGNDDGYGYYAGVVWNTEGITYVPAATRLAKTESYFSGTRNFAENTFTKDGNFGISEFNLPAEVVYATGVRLVDVTKDVYAMSGNGASYTNQGGTNDGKKVIATNLDPFAYTILGPGDGNTDGYDLDAIRVQGPDVMFGNRHLKPALTIDKVTNGSDGPFIEKGAPITWTYKVTNTGECDLSNVVVTDDKAGPVGTIASLPKDQSATLTKAGTAVAGEYKNLGTAEGVSLLGDKATASDPSNYFGSDPSVKIVKTTNGGDGLHVPMGSAVTWLYEVTNTGNVKLTDIAVSDDKLGSVGTTPSLDPGESVTFTASGTAVRDLYENLGTVTGKPPVGANVSDDDPSSYFGEDPKIDIEKTGAWVDADGDDHAEVNEVINYTFTVKNAGNIPLSNVTVTDPKCDAPGPVYESGDANLDGKLDLTETWIFKGKHTLTQGDIDAGSPTTIDTEKLAAALPASASMKVAGNGTADADSYFPTVTLGGAGVLNGTYDGWCVDVDHTISQNTSYTTAVYSSYEALPAGIVEKPYNFDLVNWIMNQDFVYKNAGGTLGNYTYGDIQRAIWTLIDDNLSTSGLGTYSQARVNQIVSLAVANGEGYVPKCNGVVAIILQPTGGTVQVIGVQGVLIPLVGHCETQFHNCAVADSEESLPDEDCTDTTLPKHPSVAIDKQTVDGTKSGDGLSILVGEPIKWTYKVTNTGNVTLHNIVVRDSDASADIGVIAELAPGASETLERSGTSIKGAYANGSSADPNEAPAATDRSWYTGQDPQVTVNKVTIDSATSGDGLNILTGEPIKWRYEVKSNTGNVALKDIVVSDSVAGVTPAPVTVVYNTKTYNVGDTNHNNALETTETWIYEASGTSITGAYSNTGTASGSYTDSGNHTRTDTSTDTSNYFGANPQISVDKKTNGPDDGGFIHVGDTVTWTYVVTNVGNVPLGNVTVTDNAAGVAFTAPKTTLAVGESMTCTAVGKAIEGPYTNVGTASGSYTDSAGHTRTDTESDSSKYFGSAPAVELTKSGKWVDGDGNGFADVGEVINYTFSVKNTGNVVLYDLKLADLVGGVTVAGGPIESLAVGATDASTFTGSYIITSADLDAEKFVNTAEVSGHGPADDAVSDTDDETVVLPPKPVLGVERQPTRSASWSLAQTSPTPM